MSNNIISRILAMVGKIINYRIQAKQSLENKMGITAFTKKFGLVLVLLLFICSASFAATKTWTNGFGNNRWTTGGNWSGGTVPANNDDVIIPAGFDNSTITRVPNRILNSLSIASANVTLVANGAASLTITNTNATAALSIDGSVTFGDGTVNGDVGLTFQSITTATNVSGTLTMSANTTLDIQNTTLNVSGTLAGTGAVTISSGTLNIGGTFSNTGTFTAGTGTVNYNGTIAQTIANKTYYDLGTSNNGTKDLGTAVVATNSCTINSPSILNCNNNNLTGTASFTLQNGAGLQIGSTSGIATIGATGNIRVTGTRTFNTGADYTYNGTSGAQVTGTGLPASVNSLTINNTNGVTMNSSIVLAGNPALTLSSGILFANANSLSVTNTATDAVSTGSSTSYINLTTGSLSRTLNSTGTNIYFPIGNSTCGGAHQFTLNNPTLGAGSVLKVSYACTGVGTADGTSITSLPFTYNWKLELVSGSFTSTDIKVESSDIDLTHAIGYCTTQGGTYSLMPNCSTATGYLTAAGLTSLPKYFSPGVPFVSTYYSYQTGSWNTATTWTIDPSGTTQVGSTIPSSNSVVNILSGRTVTLPSNIATTSLDLNLEAGSFLDLSTFQFTAGLKSLSGQGTLRISSAIFPTPIVTNNFVNAGGGTTEYNAGVSLPSQAIYNNLTINASALVVTQVSDIILNGNLNVKNGTFRINDNTPLRRLKLTVNGDVTVDAGAFISVGTGATNTVTSPLGIVGGTAPFIDYYDLQSHRIVLNGNFTNNGTVRFTNLSYPIYNSFPPTATGATTGFATVYFQGATDNTLFCNGRTDFYNLVLDKGVDQTFKLTIYSSASSYSNFRLFGANIAGGDGGGANPNLKKALWIRTGTLVLEGLVVIPSLSEGTAAGEVPVASPNSDYYIPANGALVVNGYDVIVQTTADSYQEVNAAYQTIPLAPDNATIGISTSGAGSSFGLYGKLEMDNGYLTTKESSGILTNSTSSGQFIINNGTVDTKQFLSLTGGASFEQNGGLFLLRGRFQRTPSAYASASNLATAPLNTIRANDALLTGTAGTFNINNANNIFIMSGGTMRIYDVCGTVAPTYAFQVNSSAANTSVSGGIIEFVPTTGTGGTADVANHLVSTTASLANVTINKASSGTIIQLSNALNVLNNLTITSGDLNANNFDVTIGGNFSIASGTTYTPGTNTTTFNGTGIQTFTVNLAGALALNKLTIDKPAGIALNFAGTQQAINVADNFRVVLGTMNDNGNTINLKKDAYNSGIHSGTGSIIMSGTVAQVIDGDGNGIFENLTLNNNTGTSPISLAANTTINKTLTFSQDKLFNIGTYNLKLNASATIVNGGALRYIQTAGNSGDGGLTKAYSSTVPFIFPIGAPSTSHALPNYTPATIGFSIAPTTYGSVTIIPVGYEHPASTINGQSLTYFWRVKSSGFVGVTFVSHSFTYSQNDVVGTETNYVPALYNRGTFAWTSGTNANPPIDIAANTFTDWASSLGFLDADYTAGDNAFGATVKFYSVGATPQNWNSTAAWSHTSGGGAIGGAANVGVTIPGPNSIVVIEGNHYINLVANVSCASLQIASGSILDIHQYTGSNFGMVLNHSSGTNGLFRLRETNATPSVYVFPLGDFSDFNVNKGTTEFYTNSTGNTDLYVLPANVTSYGNLILSPSGGANLSLPNNSSTTIYGDFTCNSSNVNSWIAMSWNTSNWPWNNPGLFGNPTIEKTVHVVGNMSVNGGTFEFMDDYVAQHLIVDGNVTVANSANAKIDCIENGWVGGGIINNTFAIGGSLINNSSSGVRLLRVTKYCDVTFFGSSSASITNSAGTPTTIFNKVTVNKGASQATTLTCNIGGTLTTLTDNWLTLQNGTFIHNRAGNNFTITTGSTFTIPATSGLNITNANNVYLANANSNTNDLFLNGKLTILSGNVYIGPIAAPANNNDIEYSGGGESEIEIQGGTLVVNGQIRRNTAVTNGILTYKQSGGTVTINGNAANTTNAKLEVLNTGSTFNMSNGILNIIRGGGGATYGDLYLRPEFSTVTGGTINFTNVAPNTLQNYLLDATSPLNNLTITGTGTAGINANVKLIVNPLVLKGNFTLANPQSIFDANATYNIDLTVKGNFVNNGTYSHQNNLTTFNGGTPTLSGSSVTDFYNLNVSPITSLTLSRDITVLNNITLGDIPTFQVGALICGTFKVNVKKDVINNASYTNTNTTSGLILNGITQQHISGSGTFGQLELNNITGATFDSYITLQKDLVMTNGILDINKYLLTLGQNSNIVLNGAPYSSAKMITSDGVWSNVGIVKVFGSPLATTFTYPMGTAGKYTPAVLTITANGSVGSIRVNNINEHHPAVIDPTNVLKYFWEVESTGIVGFTGNLLLKYLPTDVVGGPESSYVAAQLLTPGTNWSKATPGPGTDNVNETNHTITFTYSGSSNLTGECTAGNDLAIPSTVPQYTSIADGNWTNNLNWVPSGGSTYPCPVGGPNGFIVTINHVVTANANYCFSYKTYINNTLKVITPFFGHNFGTIYGNGTLYLESAVFPAGRFTTFLDCAGSGTLEFGGSGTYDINADLYTSVPNMTVSGTGSRLLPDKDLTICKQLLINGPSLDNSVFNRNLTIKGSMLLTSGLFKSGSGGATVTFAGTSAQTLSNFTGTNSFNNLEINNSLGLTLTGSVDVSKNLLLTNGLITTSATNKLTITNYLTSCVYPNGGSSTSYIDGPLIKNLNQGDPLFIFPIGKIANGLGNKLSIRATQTGTLLWTAEYFNPNTYSTYAAPLTSVNTKEYWTLSNVPAGSQAFVKLDWDPVSDLTPLMTQNGLSDMRVAQHNGTDWVEVISTPAGNSYNGSVETTGKATFTASTNNFTVGCINTPKPRIRMTPAGPVCGTAGIPVSLTSSLAIVAPFTVTYTENGVAKSITPAPASFPTSISTIAGGGTYILTGFTYNYPAGTPQTGVFDVTPVIVSPVPTAAAAGTDQPLCGANSAVLAGNNPAIGTGLWTITSGTGGNVATPTVYNSNFTGTNGSAYTLRWTISSGACTSFDDVNISFPLMPLQPSPFSVASASVCKGVTGVTYTVPNDPTATSYIWGYSGAGATITHPITPNSASIDFSAIATSGTLSVAITNACGTSTDRTYAITVNSLPAFTFTGSSIKVCEGDLFTLTTDFTAIATPYTIDIKKEGASVTGYPLSAQSADPYLYNENLVWIGPGAGNLFHYLVTVTDANNCISSSPSDVQVTVYKIPVTGPEYHVPNNFGF